MGVQLNEDKMWSVTLTISPVLVAQNTTAEQTFTLSGLLASDIVIDVTKPTSQPGLTIGNTRVSAANTLAITFINDTGSGITPTASEVYKATIFRPEKIYTSVPA